MNTCEWQSVNDDMVVRCTTCGKEFQFANLQAVATDLDDVPNYCPHCGAKTKE